MDEYMLKLKASALHKAEELECMELPQQFRIKIEEFIPGDEPRSNHMSCIWSAWVGGSPNGHAPNAKHGEELDRIKTEVLGAAIRDALETLTQKYREIVEADDPAPGPAREGGEA